MKARTLRYGTLRETDTGSVTVLTDEDKERDRSRDSTYPAVDQHSGTPGVTNNVPTMSPSFFKRLALCAKENILLVALVASLVVGVVLGCALRLLTPPLSDQQQLYLQFPGEILMNMLKLLILPLIVSSLISGMTSLNQAASGKMIARAVCYYLCSMMLAVILGIILVISIRPGDKGRSLSEDTSDDQDTVRHVAAGDTFLDLVRQLFPDNLIQACFSKEGMKKSTKLTLVDGSENRTNAGKEYKRSVVREDGINMLGLVSFSVAFGIAINHLGEKGRPLKDFVEALAQATLLIVNAVIWYSPLGIMFLVAAQIVGLEDARDSIQQLGLYMLTVILGLAIHGLVLLPILFFVLVRKNPYKFLGGMLQALVTALGTSSSSATIPVTMRNLYENNGVDPRVISFVIPVGSTINMDGTALYEAVATIFIGQMNGLDLSLGQVITICITATAAAIGAAGVPQAGLVTMVIVLESVGFPTSGIAMILAVDWMLDRFRTVVNVLGDAYGAGIVDHYSKGEADKLGLSEQVPLIVEGSDTPMPELDDVNKAASNGVKDSVHTASQQTSFCGH